MRFIRLSGLLGILAGGASAQGSDIPEAWKQHLYAQAEFQKYVRALQRVHWNWNLKAASMASAARFDFGSQRAETPGLEPVPRASSAQRISSGFGPRTYQRTYQHAGWFFSPVRSRTWRAASLT